MLRRLAPALIVMLAVLAACQGTPALTDPADIIAQGFDATADLKTFHVSVAVDGTVTMPETGGTFSLEGTTLEADIDIEGEQLSFSFAVPAMMGLNGDLRIIGQDLWVKVSMLGTKWQHMDLGEFLPGASAAPSAVASPDIQAMIDQVRDFLAKEGVVTTKEEDVNCGDRKCYHVQVTIPPEVMTDAGTDAVPSFDPSTIFGDALVLDLLFDRENLWLTEVATSIDSEEAGTFSARVTFSAFDAEVTVSPPPLADVTEGEFTLPGF